MKQCKKLFKLIWKGTVEGLALILRGILKLVYIPIYVFGMIFKGLTIGLDKLGKLVKKIQQLLEKIK